MSHDQPSVVSTTATRSHHGAILASLELSTSRWLVTSLLPGTEKLSRHTLRAGDADQLLGLFARLRGKAERRLGGPVEIITIQEAGLDGFWLHRLLERAGIRSHVVDAASIPVPRRGRRAKSDKLDGESLWRTLAAWLRGEPRVCSMVRPPSPEQEDQRRLGREYDTLTRERTRQSNRIRGLLAAQGIRGYNPLLRNRRAALAKLTTGDGRPLGAQLVRELMRALDRIELLMAQLAQIKAERRQLLKGAAADPVAAQLSTLKGIGPSSATTLALEAFFRSFDNRRQLAAFAGLAATPWRSGKVEHEQGISKAGNKRIRRTMIEIAWLWLRHQCRSALSQWFFTRCAEGTHGKRNRCVFIVALARKLIVAIWRFVSFGEIPEGAMLKA
ncbi:IS110 family transposase [Mesorhizobium sp. L-8-10]|uniref:IS110 family transposase n=1 Tax=Mesorhizobium sp. L-8-10 TaxID=2744523 RepID=UPI0019255003|nr:IS110 family transposase [Mesorhizobium sp. L-8-10]BCH31593.1 IS110 family transposase [Mesorhizobium sp. L-8-10]